MSGKSVIPLLSIAIPTKNRYRTLTATLQAMMNEFDDCVEFVISDNSDDNTSFLENDGRLFIADARVNYVYIKDKISIVENTECVLGNCKGEFVCFIGDDDLVSPIALDYLKGIMDSPIDAISYPGCYYWWNDVHFVKKSYYNRAGAFWYPRAIPPSKIVSSENSLADLLNGGGVSIGNLPRLYHGIIRRSVLEKLKNQAGKYVLGASPDMALAVSIALLGVSTNIIEVPLTVYGASKNSGGGWTAENKHHGSIYQQEHIPQFTKDNWSGFLPPVWSEHTIYPQTIFEVYMFFDKQCNLNLNEFYASMFVNEKHLRKILLPFVYKHYSQNKDQLIYFLYSAIKKSVGRFKRFIESFLKKRKFDVYHSFSIEAVITFLKNRH